MKYIVVGLGNFGSSLALKLAEGGHEVIGVDCHESYADKYKDQLTHTLIMDSTNELAVSQLPLSDSDGIIICIGEDSGAAITTAALLKKHAPESRIVARATSEIQGTIFETMGIKEIVNPEVEYAENFANHLTISGNITTYLLDDKYEIAEFKVPESFVNKTLQEVDTVSNLKVSLITIIRHGKRKNILGKEVPDTKVLGVVTGATKFEENDTLMLFGKITDLENLMESVQD